MTYTTYVVRQISTGLYTADSPVLLFARSLVKRKPPPSPDESLRAAILAVMALHDRIVLMGLRVGVLNGIVHLAGEVPSLAIRAAVEELARTVPGVHGVVNRIDAPGAPSPSRVVTLRFRNEKGVRCSK